MEHGAGQYRRRRLYLQPGSELEPAGDPSGARLARCPRGAVRRSGLPPTGAGSPGSRQVLPTAPRLRAADPLVVPGNRRAGRGSAAGDRRGGADGLRISTADPALGHPGGSEVARHIDSGRPDRDLAGYRASDRRSCRGRAHCTRDCVLDPPYRDCRDGGGVGSRPAYVCPRCVLHLDVRWNLACISALGAAPPSPSKFQLKGIKCRYLQLRRSSPRPGGGPISSSS
jgi:hypothetical protein